MNLLLNRYNELIYVIGEGEKFFVENETEKKLINSFNLLVELDYKKIEDIVLIQEDSAYIKFKNNQEMIIYI